MKKLLAMAALAAATGPALAADPNIGKGVVNIQGALVPSVVYCTDNNGKLAACPIQGAGATSTNGGVLPGQASPSSARVTVGANSATPISPATAGRIFLTVQLEASPSANVYLCFTQTTACSATNYDVFVSSGAAIGTLYSAPFGFTNAVYAFSTSSIALNTESWVSQ